MESQKPIEILQILQSNGFEAYFVGGCVRDSLLGRAVHDWDITTSAFPEQVMACFSHCLPTGIKHGTVTVLHNGFRAEVTTYRTDGAYLDARHPERVTFVRELSQDLARRDFTINAMAMDKYGSVVDLHGGIDDLKKRRMRCVGLPDKRFREDALRMLRAFRFSAQLGFGIEEETERAIKRNARLCAELSAERVRDEIEKTLCSPHPERLDDMAQIGLLERYRVPKNANCGWLSSLPKEPVVRWAGLCRTWPEIDLADFRLSRGIVRDAAAGRRAAPEDRLGWKILIAEIGLFQCRILAALEGKTELVEHIVSSGECLSLRDLAVRAADFPELSGPEIGMHLRKLLMHVLKHPQDNHREILKRID